MYRFVASVCKLLAKLHSLRHNPWIGSATSLTAKLEYQRKCNYSTAIAYECTEEVQEVLANLLIKKNKDSFR